MAKLTTPPVSDLVTGDEPIVQGVTRRMTLGAFPLLIVPYAPNWSKSDRGDLGLSDDKRLGLATLKAAAIVDGPRLYDGSLWTWTLGDFSGRADDVLIVKANSKALTVGAWLRSIDLPGILSVSNFGPVGTADDTATLQKAIDFHRLLPSDLKCRTSLRLAGRHVVSTLVGTQDNNGLTINGGKLVRKVGSGLGPNALLTFKQEADSIIPLDGITVRDVEFEGSAQYTSTDPTDAADTAASMAKFQYCNGVEFYSDQADQSVRGVRNCRVENIRGRRLGKSLVIFDEPESCSAIGVYAEQCLGHAVGVSAVSDHTTWRAGRKLSINVQDVSGVDTMTLLDLSSITDYSQGTRFYAYANISGLSGRKIRGRSKIAGVWGFNVNGVTVDNEGLVDANGNRMRLWAALELAALDYSGCNVSNVVARSMIAAVRGTAHLIPSSVCLSNISAISCNEGVNIRAKRVLIKNLSTEDTYVPVGWSPDNEAVEVSGFSFKRINRASYLGALSDYGNVATPNKALTLTGGVISAWTTTPGYDDFFIYVGSGCCRVTLKDIVITDAGANPFRHLVRNDSAEATLIVDNVAAEAGTFKVANGLIYNNTPAADGADLFMTRCAIQVADPAAAVLDDPYAGTLQRIGKSTYQWVDADGYPRIKNSRPTSRTDGSIMTLPT